MQIEVVDDCSRDNAESIVRKIGQGRAQFFRRTINGGPTENFNTCLKRSRGFLIHVLHGDDYVLPGFYNFFGNAFETNACLAMVASRCLTVDAQGEIDSLTPRVHGWERPSSDPAPILVDNVLKTPAVVIRRSFYEEFGGFRADLFHVADWEMWVRAVHLGGALFLNQPLAAYRTHSENHTSRLQQTGNNLREFLQLADLWELQGHEWAATQLRHRVPYWALDQANYFRAVGNFGAANANQALFRESLYFVPRFVRLKRSMRRSLVWTLRTLSGILLRLRQRREGPA
jgi:glycosyltransferase involved in cell wall biosynthesis